ncbi:HD domain-containing protein [Plectosphaerella cucumerina]|uniref:5'-deoxynucleotidase n=1 Tax=Plectosphaerella cucumerina TaxID=40658 RepID=A0A8K0TPF6_9PEZI|nr:HD domain-containing protein [Plectosphaerella cucumerina]
MSPSAVNNTADPAAVPETRKVDVSDLGFIETPKVEGPWSVDKVIAVAPNDTPGFTPPSDSPLPYFHLLERLKTTKREGWRRFGIERGESIADHMYRMSLLTFACPAALRPRLDLNRCIKMCLIHDMAESLVGDITPVDGVAKPEKNRREAETMDYITKNLMGGLDGGVAGEEMRAVWQEYEDSKTLESLFVHDLDKMELLLQMFEYEKRGRRTLDLGEFAYVATKFALPETREWAQQLLAEREVFWGAGKHVHGEEGVAGGVKPDTRQQQDSYYSKQA